MVGLNRPLNIIRHKLGLYPVFMDGRCMWCGEKKCGVTKLNQLKGTEWVGVFAPNGGHDPNNPYPLKRKE